MTNRRAEGKRRQGVRVAADLRQGKSVRLTVNW